MKLLDKLKNYSQKDIIPFHMPGHKRKFLCPDLPYNIDITEIDGFDNLQNPKEILKDCLDKASKVFGSYKTFFSVNGGTCGCLSALATYCDIGDKIIIATNCHKSIYNFIEVFNLKAIYVAPKYDKFGIAKSFCATDFEKVVDNNLDAKAVVITSPTYEGVISDIKDIAQFLHSKNIPLIVDEAHGTHLVFENKSALNYADIVLNSCHKTLPSLTQTALVHVGNNALNKELVAKLLQDKINKFQSSSPSYILMASIDECVEFVKKNGEKEYKKFVNNLGKFEKKSKELKCIKIINYNEPCDYFEFDKSKILLTCPFMNGKKLMNELRKKGFELEMSYNNYCLAMTTIMDDKSIFDKFFEALLLIDNEISLKNIKKSKKTMSQNENFEKDTNVCKFSFDRSFPLTIHDVTKQKGEYLDIYNAIGKISKEYIYAYPPGSPVLIPGEKITKQFIEMFDNMKNNGTEFGSTSGELKNNKICVVK